MKIETILSDLMKIMSVSGFENEMCEQIERMMCSFCDTVEINRFNSVICHKKSKNPHAEKIMIEAHLDQIGLMVKEFDEKGHIKFISVGGIDKRILPGSEVLISGKENVYGVIGSKPPHLKEKADKDKMPDIDELLIDTGYTKVALEEKISIGDSIVLKSVFNRLVGDNYCGKALDNRAGMAAVIAAATEISDSPYEIYYVFTSEEELGLHGAYSAAKEIKPDYAIVVDVTHGKTIDTENEAGVFELGCGAVICRGPSLNCEVSQKLVDISERAKIKYDIEVASGHSGTNAWVIQKAWGSCKTGLVSIPLKYMHTSVEMINISDIKEV